MKTVLLLLAAMLAGCATTVQLVQPEGRYAPAIHAASSIGFSSDRSSTLRDIAAKTDLTEAEQLYLVNVVNVRRGFSSDIKGVLVTLLKNKSVAEAARRRISEILPKLGLFSSDAKEVADALAG